MEKPVLAAAGRQDQSIFSGRNRRTPRPARKWLPVMDSITAAPTSVEQTDPITPILMEVMNT